MRLDPARERAPALERVELHQRLEAGLLSDFLRERRIAQDRERSAVGSRERRLPVVAPMVGHGASLLTKRG